MKYLFIFIGGFFFGIFLMSSLQICKEADNDFLLYKKEKV